MTWHWVDYIIMAVIGLSVLTGLFRGFVKELIALCIWILAIWLAYHFSPSIAVWLEPYINDITVRTAASFILILMATLITGGLFNALLGFILSRSGLSGTDRLLGMGFGLVRGVFIVALVMLIVQLTSLPDEDYRRQSQLYTRFDPLVHWISGYIPEFIRQVKVYDQTIPETEISLANHEELNLSQFDKR